jgi:hypothetical protein
VCRYLNNSQRWRNVNAGANQTSPTKSWLISSKPINLRQSFNALAQSPSHHDLVATPRKTSRQSPCNVATGLDDTSTHHSTCISWRNIFTNFQSPANGFGFQGSAPQKMIMKTVTTVPSLLDPTKGKDSPLAAARGPHIISRRAGPSRSDEVKVIRSYRDYSGNPPSKSERPTR